MDWATGYIHASPPMRPLASPSYSDSLYRSSHFALDPLLDHFQRSRHKEKSHALITSIIRRLSIIALLLGIALFALRWHGGRAVTADRTLHCFFLLDRSGSMSSLSTSVVRGFNDYVSQQQQQPGTMLLTLVQFDDRQPFEVIHDAQDIRKVCPTIVQPPPHMGEVTSEGACAVLLTTVDTCPTRWGNQFSQVAHKNLLRAIIDLIVEAYKRDNWGGKEAIVEADDDDSNSKLGNAVPAAQIGLSAEDWDKSLELQSFLDNPFQIKQSIEHKDYTTGSQALYLICDLIKGCSDDKSLTIKLHPTSPKLDDRTRRTEVRTADQLHDVISKGRTIIDDQLNGRFFGERPSNTRLAQIYMSKQCSAEKWFPGGWHGTARAVYLRMLRAAVSIAGLHELSPQKKSNVQRQLLPSQMQSQQHEPFSELAPPSVPLSKKLRAAGFEASREETSPYTAADDA
ncbi:MAG: hypothetical protein SGPRY_006891, partial [Prymnesium sp.]